MRPVLGHAELVGVLGVDGDVGMTAEEAHQPRGAHAAQAGHADRGHPRCMGRGQSSMRHVDGGQVRPRAVRVDGDDLERSGRREAQDADVQSEAGAIRSLLRRERSGDVGTFAVDRRASDHIPVVKHVDLDGWRPTADHPPGDDEGPAFPESTARGLSRAAPAMGAALSNVATVQFHWGPVPSVGGSAGSACTNSVTAVMPVPPRRTRPRRRRTAGRSRPRGDRTPRRTRTRLPRRGGPEPGGRSVSGASGRRGTS